MHTPKLLGTLSAYDFDENTVTVILEDGSLAVLHSAFYEYEGDWVVVYTEHAGYHSFYRASIVKLFINDLEVITRA